MSRSVAQPSPFCLSPFAKSVAGPAKRWMPLTWNLFLRATNSPCVKRRRQRIQIPCLIVLAALLCFGGLATGQVNPGTPSFSAYDSHEVDRINLQNLNILVATPVMSKSGAFPFSYRLAGNSYMSDTSSGLLPGLAHGGLIGSADGMIIGVSSSPKTKALCPDGVHSTFKYTNWSVVSSDGTSHPLPASDYVDYPGTGGSSCYNEAFTALTTDGSGYLATINVQTCGGLCALHDRAGNHLTPSSVTDTNNNNVSRANVNGTNTVTFKDTLGMSPVLTESPVYPGDNFIQGGSLTWTDVSLGSPEVTVSASSSFHLKSAFGCSGITDYDDSGYTLPTSINFLPDSTSIALGYEGTPGFSGDYTGRLGTITLRSGGTVTYGYSGSNNGLNCTYMVPPQMTRTTSDGTTTYTWAAVNNRNGNWGNTTTVLDQAGNKTVYTFTGLTATGNALPPVVQAVTEIQYYTNWGTVSSPNYSLAKQVVYCYNGGVSPTVTLCPNNVVSGPVTQLAVFTTLGGMSSASESYTTYDDYGNVTYSAQYDFGGTSPVTATTITYGSWNGSACVGISSVINNKPCQVVTTQGSNTVGFSRFTYSSTGNLLTSYVSPNGGSTFLSNSTQNVYNGNGTSSTIYDLANNPTTYGYNAGSYVSCGGCTNYPFPTSITKGGLTTSSTWSGTGGVMLTQVGPNGGANQTTTYGYTDPWNRVGSIQDPLGNTVYKTYSATSLASTFSFNSGSSVNNTTVTLDGYGRTVKTQTQQGPGSSNYDTVSVAYGFSGGGPPNQAYISTNVPCTAALNSTCTVTDQIFYDMLGRVGWTSIPATGEYVQTQYPLQDVLQTLAPAPSGESTKSVQTEYDAFGRPISVCNISPNSVSGSVPCGQKNGSYNGVLTGYSYASTTGSQTVSRTRGVQTRSTTVDGLGRVTSSTTPEGGTTQYFWDAAPPVCWNNQGWPTPGDLGARKDNAGTYICYGYDALHRLVGALTRPSGPCFGFIYDSATPPAGSGITVQNTAGRMVEAYTNNDCNGTTNVVTDEWFSYDKGGHMTDMWELTPHSTQYYHSTATFAGNGIVTSLQLASPSLYTMNYTLDGEGRWNKLAQGSSNIVTGPTQMYNAAGQATEVDLTGTDKDLYTYDPNTGDMTQYEFKVGGANETGVLSWNVNGTLQSLAITDGFNSGGTQTCYFNPTLAPTTGYDDLGRLVGVDCGSGHWGQDFAYDQYDNLTQAVIPSRPGSTWNPGYNSSNNYVMGATYDASGNMTNDGGMNVYGYNLFDKLAWAAVSGTPTCGTSGKCITYDAFGRMVEKSNGGAWSEIWYTQVPGSQITMSGTTASYGYWPSPGRGTFVAGGSNVFLHQDWLGNDRIVSSVSAHTVAADRAYAPYGEQYNTFGSTNPIYGMFAGITGDFDSGILFDTPNRELAQYQGRWISPDPAGSGWNQYAYPTNPNSMTDPLGLCEGLRKAPPTGCGGGGIGYGGGFFLGTDLSDPTMEFGLSALYKPQGTVGADGGSVSAATNAYFDSLDGTQGDVTQERADAEPVDVAGLAELLGAPGFGGPANNSLTMRQILNQAKQRALRTLKNPRCNAAFGGHGFGADRINDTNYSILPASAFSNPNDVAQTQSPVSVKLNSQGAFFTSSTMQVGLMFGPTPITLSGDMGRAFVLLHELAHQLSGVTGAIPEGHGPDSAAAGEINNQFVYDNCVAQ
jgi:RHS repeat-associated protein